MKMVLHALLFTLLFLIIVLLLFLYFMPIINCLGHPTRREGDRTILNKQQIDLLLVPFLVVSYSGIVCLCYTLQEQMPPNVMPPQGHIKK